MVDVDRQDSARTDIAPDHRRQRAIWLHMLESQRTEVGRRLLRRPRGMCGGDLLAYFQIVTQTQKQLIKEIEKSPVNPTKLALLPVFDI